MSTIRRVITGGAAIVLGVFAGVALAKAGATGFDRHVEALGLHHTGLFAWIQLIYALLLLAMAASWGSGASTGFLGAVGAVFGFVLLISGESLHDSLGAHAENGVLYVVAGGLVALFGFLTAGEPGVRRQRLA